MNNGSSRRAILDRVREATGNDGNRDEVSPRNYIHHGSLDAAGCMHLMSERLREYGAEVVEALPADLPPTIVHQIQISGPHHILAPPGLPAEWLGNSVNWRLDHDLSDDEIEHCEGVVTLASAGIADSGTIALHHGPGEGRRVITLLPDFHLCILRATQIVETLPEYFARFPRPSRLATWISGPSATADIEMTRIKGVHGPRFLSVIIMRDDK